MKLTLFRDPSSEYSTLGMLLVDDHFSCYTLEDPIRDRKIYGKTAIPAGTYKIQITYSPRFGRLLPLLLGVPDFSGVRIHPGNVAEDTDGCILVGERRGQDVVLDSRLAFERLMPKLMKAHVANEPISIEIIPALEEVEPIEEKENHK